MIKCAICEKEFEPKRKNQDCCSEECSQERQRNISRWNKKLINKLSLSDINRMAREKGMSYGQFIARYEGRF